MLFSIVAVCLVATAMGQPPQDTDRIQLTMYYESLCSDSISFFKNQLSPSYDALKKYITVDFVPFGKATQTITNGSYSFTCHHKENECYGNIVQACATEQLHGEDVYKVINCLMTTVNPASVTNDTYPTRTCLEKFTLTPTKLDNCIHSQDGLRLLSEMGNKTTQLNPKLESVPSVAVNRKFDYTESKEAVKNLRGFICKKLKGSKKTVEECNGTGIVTSSVLLMALSTILRTFISS